jgi:DNA-binding IclR family transcriptional regulator
MPQAVQVTFNDLQRIASDRRLTLEAKAILFYLTTRPAGYRLTIADLVSMSPAGPKTVYSRLKELIALGYLSRKLVQGGADYFVHPTPLNVAVEVA